MVARSKKPPEKGLVERCQLRGMEALRYVPDRRSPSRFHLFYEFDFIPARIKRLLKHEQYSGHN